MPPPEWVGREKYAVLWPKVGEDESTETLVGPPVELDPSRGTGVAWNWSVTDQQGGQDAGHQSYDATANVDRKVPTGSIMWLGRLRDFVDDGTNTLMEVVRYDEAEDVRGQVTAHRVSLARYRGKLPQVVS